MTNPHLTIERGSPFAGQQPKQSSRLFPLILLSSISSRSNALKRESTRKPGLSVDASPSRPTMLGARPEESSRGLRVVAQRCQCRRCELHVCEREIIPLNQESAATCTPPARTSCRLRSRRDSRARARARASKWRISRAVSSARSTLRASIARRNLICAECCAVMGTHVRTARVVASVNAVSDADALPPRLAP